MNEFYKTQFKAVHEQWKDAEKTLIKQQIIEAEKNNTDIR